MSGKIQIWLGVLGVVAIGLLLWRVDHLTGEIKEVKAAHEKTALKLADAEKDRDAWRDATGRATVEAFAQRDNAQACLDREVLARTAATERAAIMSQAKPRPRPKQEEIVDHETRSRVAGRLNRPL